MKQKPKPLHQYLQTVQKSGIDKEDESSMFISFDAT